MYGYRLEVEEGMGPLVYNYVSFWGGYVLTYSDSEGIRSKGVPRSEPGHVLDLFIREQQESSKFVCYNTFKTLISMGEAVRPSEAGIGNRTRWSQQAVK